MSAKTSQNQSCIFCDIAKKVRNEELIYEDEEVCAFNDYRPVSRFHVLVIPKRHIPDVKCLESTDKDLVTKMHRVGEALLLKDKSLSLSDARLGYHWPPFLSVKHLHLHVIAPASELSFLHRVFKTNSIWFVSPEYIASRYCNDTNSWLPKFDGTKLLSIFTSLLVMWIIYPFLVIRNDSVKNDVSL